MLHSIRVLEVDS